MLYRHRIVPLAPDRKNDPPLDRLSKNELGVIHIGVVGSRDRLEPRKQ